MQNIKYRFEYLFETLLLEPQAVSWRLPVAASQPSCVPGSTTCSYMQPLCLCSPLAVLAPLLLLRLKKAKLWHSCRSTYSSLFIFVCLMACSVFLTLCTVVRVHWWQRQSSLPELNTHNLSNLWYSDVSVLQNVISCSEDISCFQLKHHLWAESSAPRSTSTI